ncbi:MAG: hypothetical protein EBR82_70665 [Caulobacteraceae bacterium]|nr:hypothetical protein [Caulobacteraceae bacterium]
MTKPYIVTKQPVVTKPLLGTSEWARQATVRSEGSLWNNGTFVVRDVRGKPGIISNHARGLAMDLSYRWQAQKNLGRQDGRKVSLAFIVKLLDNADALGIQLVIDYALKRSWKCDRGTWQAGNFEEGDWYHIEIDPTIANDAATAKACWISVFGVSPQQAPQSV